MNSSPSNVTRVARTPRRGRIIAALVAGGLLAGMSAGPAAAGSTIHLSRGHGSPGVGLWVFGNGCYMALPDGHSVQGQVQVKLDGTSIPAVRIDAGWGDGEWAALIQIPDDARGGQFNVDARCVVMDGGLDGVISQFEYPLVPYRIDD